VDTHMAALVLTETAGRYGAAMDAKIDAALVQVLRKVQAAQGADGSFDSNGWAPILSHSIAAQSLINAKEQGRMVDEDVLKKAEAYNDALVDGATGRADSSKGAGVGLYGAATGLSTNAQSARGGNKSARAKADAAQGAIMSNTEAMIQGFGSVGGEEMLSYMMISDTLATDGGKDWKSWEKRIGTHLTTTQNADGSWSGHHCITSTTFVTATALMTLTAEQNQLLKTTGGARSPAKGSVGGGAQEDGSGDMEFAPIPPAGSFPTR